MALKKRVTKKFRSAAAMAGFAAALLTKALHEHKGRLVAALPGGRTPRPLFKALSGGRADWSRAHFLMTDERLVPAGSPHSNFGQARRLLFSKLRLPPAGLHPVRGIAPVRAASAYEAEIAGLARASGGLDIVCLGLGQDGHIASIFNGSTAISEKKKNVLAVKAPAGIKPASRVTLTLKAINSAGTIILMAAGPSKKAAFARAAAGDTGIPAGRLGGRGNVYYLFSETGGKNAN